MIYQVKKVYIWYHFAVSLHLTYSVLKEPSEENPEDQIKEEDKEQPQGAEVKGQTIHDSQNVEQSDTAHDQAGESENNQEEVINF